MSMSASGALSKPNLSASKANADEPREPLQPQADPSHAVLPPEAVHRSPQTIPSDTQQAQDAGGQPEGTRSATKLKLSSKIARWFGEWDPSVELANKGSVARDHLANERTFLAWLRTSLAMASVGVAVTQLFRLHSAIYTTSSSSSSSSPSSLPSATPSAEPSGTLGPSAVASAIASLQAQVDYQSGLLAEYADSERSDRRVFQDLGKPIGATLIAISIVLLVMGVWRFFLVQRVLTRDKFPPARVSVIVSAFFVGSIIVAAFAVIMALQ